MTTTAEMREILSHIPVATRAEEIAKQAVSRLENAIRLEVWAGHTDRTCVQGSCRCGHDARLKNLRGEG